jgi:hypothetical protein
LPWSRRAQYTPSAPSRAWSWHPFLPPTSWRAAWLSSPGVLLHAGGLVPVLDNSRLGWLLVKLFSLSLRQELTWHYFVIHWRGSVWLQSRRSNGLPRWWVKYFSLALVTSAFPNRIGGRGPLASTCRFLLVILGLLYLKHKPFSS